jgi:hypothetical protein
MFDYSACFELGFVVVISSLVVFHYVIDPIVTVCVIFVKGLIRRRKTFKKK